MRSPTCFQGSTCVGEVAIEKHALGGITWFEFVGMYDPDAEMTIQLMESDFVVVLRIEDVMANVEGCANSGRCHVKGTAVLCEGGFMRSITDPLGLDVV